MSAIPNTLFNADNRHWFTRALSQPPEENHLFYDYLTAQSSIDRFYCLKGHGWSSRFPREKWQDLTLSITFIRHLIHIGAYAASSLYMTKMTKLASGKYDYPCVRVLEAELNLAQNKVAAVFNNAQIGFDEVNLWIQKDFKKGKPLRNSNVELAEIFRNLKKRAKRRNCWICCTNLFKVGFVVLINNVILSKLNAK